MKKIKLFCTLGPASMNREIIMKLDNLGIDMFRINLSHTNIEDLEAILSNIKKCTKKPICLDTEGAQIRISRVEGNEVRFEDEGLVEIVKETILGNARKISFNPAHIITELKPGDLISIDFDSVLLQVMSSGNHSVTAKVISGGKVRSNRAVTVDREIALPSISEKDKKAIEIGQRSGVRHFALSFADGKKSVSDFHELLSKDSRVISKIESKRGVENLDDILAVSDEVLIDRGDLSREEPIEKIPFIQKLIVKKANACGIPVYIATNLLESMVKSKTPTRAEVNDIVNTLLDGADGLVLAAETAIGSYPIYCLTMVSKIIRETGRSLGKTSLKELECHDSFLLVEPHGGKLINRLNERLDHGRIRKYQKLEVDKTTIMDAEQIAIGSFSPLKGFMKRKELESVLENNRLMDGTIWPVPIVLQTDRENAKKISGADTLALALKDTGEIYAIIHPEEVYQYDMNKLCKKVFGTDDAKHPGVDLFMKRGNYLVGGEIELIRRLPSEYKQYEITPKQARAVFEAKGWSQVAGFHTRNVVHKVHEYLQDSAIKKYHCDGIFIHPVVGPKKIGDYRENVILKSYELMLSKYYTRQKFVLGAFQNYSRYAGPREAVFTALCRKNFGCSHFIIGRDHTGVSDYYGPYDMHEIFGKMGNIGITPIFFKETRYCPSCGNYVEECAHSPEVHLSISGTKAREMLKSGEYPPNWFMRRDVSDLVFEDMKNGNEVFVV